MRSIFLALPLLFAASAAQAVDMGACQFNNDVDAQIAACTDVIGNQDAVSSDLVDAYLYRCQAFERKGDPEAALADCLQARRLNENNASVHNSLSIIYQNLGRPGEAVSSGQMAAQLAPNDKTIHNTLSNAFCLAKAVEQSVQHRIKALELGRFTVEGLQQALKNRGFYSGAVDGDFGDSSRAALRDWTAAGCP